MLCILIVWKIDWSILQEKLGGLNVRLFPVVLLFYVLSQIVSAFKWKLLLSVHDIHFSFNKLHRYYYIAMFLNNFLPTSIGGDGYRIYKTMSNPKSKSCAIIAVVIERISGIMALLSLGFVGAVVYYLRYGTEKFAGEALVGVFAVIIVVSVIFMITGKNIVTWVTKNKRIPIRYIDALLYLKDYDRKIGVIVSVIIISFIYQMLAIFRFSIAMGIVGERSSVFDLAIVVAVSTLAGMLPVSINGIGVMDSSFIYLMGQFGIKYEPAFIIMILTRVLLIPISLMGGLLFLREKKVVVA